MSIRSQLLSCLAIFAAGAFAESMKPLGQKEFMMGYATPVWIALYHESNQTVDYRRIRGLSDVFCGHELAPPPEASVPESADKNKNVSGTDSATVVEDKVVYPAVLLVMDYHTVTPLADPESKWHPGQLLVYASAFWHLVSTAMKHFQDPRVSMQIAGVVITNSRQASPYLIRDEGNETFAKALPAMINHWRKLTKTNMNFPPGAFDIVVHMTDIKPLNIAESSTTNGSEHDSKLVVATQGSPCELEDQIAGIIIGDRMKFKGVSRAVEAMNKTLGLHKEPVNLAPAIFNKFRDEFADPIIASLTNVGKMIMEYVKPTTNSPKNELCMSAPKTIYPRGELVLPVYAQYLDENWPKCQVPGCYNDPKIWLCGKTTMLTEGCLTGRTHYAEKWIFTCYYDGPSVAKGCTL